jgi:proteasome lid subunit RPN8/RPN11
MICKFICKLKIKKADFDLIVSHAKNNLPNEACGLLAGKIEDGIKIVEKIYTLTNIDESPEHFSIHPQEQLQAIKDIRRLGLNPLGNFHSHPSTPARPSKEDIRLAYDPQASYMILSLMDETPVLKSFHIEKAKGTVLIEEITII